MSDWIEWKWNGRDYPVVPKGVKIDVEYRDGSKQKAIRETATFGSFRQTGGARDVIRYRFHTPDAEHISDVERRLIAIETLLLGWMSAQGAEPIAETEEFNLRCLALSRANSSLDGAHAD
jgi:hypothetical protein